MAEFLASQGITIAGNLLYGLLCIRLLPITERAALYRKSIHRQWKARQPKS